MFLQEHADFLAATCDSLEHDDSFDEGENLYYCDTSSASRLPTCQSGFDAIIDWYEEVSDYDQDDPPFYTTGGQIGHFTQVNHEH